MNIITSSLSGEIGSYEIPYGSGGFYFGIKASSYAGYDSNVVWFGPHDPTPATPSNLQAQLVRLGGFVVFWDEEAAARSYEVEVG